MNTEVRKVVEKALAEARSDLELQVEALERTTKRLDERRRVVAAVQNKVAALEDALNGAE